MEGYETTILVDAYPGEGAPGTLFVVEPDLKELNSAEAQAGSDRATRHESDECAADGHQAWADN